MNPTTEPGPLSPEPQPSGWLDGITRKLLVAGMAALAILALVYPESRRREAVAAIEAIHHCDLAAARAELTDDARELALAHCRTLRMAYRDQFGQEL